MCHAEVEPCYEQRSDEVGCRNPEFSEMPVERPSFRVFARPRSTDSFARIGGELRIAVGEIGNKKKIEGSASPLGLSPSPYASTA